MKITEETLPLIEKALNIKLYENQKEYLLSDEHQWTGGSDRQNGKSMGYCIKVALSDGPPLDVTQPQEFYDADYAYKKNRMVYSKVFLNIFMGIYKKLKDGGLPVRELKAES